MKLVIYRILIVALVGVSCEKIVAVDITNETPVLVLPSANDTVQINPVHFKWQAMEGATKYHLEIVTPSFGAISSYALDSIITGTNFYFALDSNEYELKLTALNAGYESKTTGPVKFWVGVQPSGSSGSMALTAPLDGAYVNGAFNKQFTWNSFTGTSSYEFSLRQGASFSTGTMLDAQNNISTTLYTTTATMTEGQYHWGVKAYLTNGGETVYTTRALFVDLTNPNTAVLSSPTDLSFLNPGFITFIWSNGTDPGTIQAPVLSLLEIATDLGFTSLVHSSSIQGNTADVNLGSGNYFWRVSNSDAAGNAASSSAVFQFSVL